MTADTRLDKEMEEGRRSVNGTEGRVCKREPSKNIETLRH